MQASVPLLVHRNGERRLSLTSIDFLLFTGSCAREKESRRPKCCAGACAVRASASKVKFESRFGDSMCLCVAGRAAMTESQQKRLTGCLNVFRESCYRKPSDTVYSFRRPGHFPSEITKYSSW
ncbi:hypothetical protein HBI27_130330 [Parastagonospora nodorum]|nr:hypothetical protein HBI27_130330 [Parastagonospora nodorum]